MNVLPTSSQSQIRLKRTGLVISPPLIIGLCLLAKLALSSTILFTLLVVFLSSFYSRRLSTCEEYSSSCKLQNDYAEAIKNRSNAVVYRSASGPQVLAFYKVLRQPQSYSLDELSATLGTTNLTIYPIIHANGPFLVIRFAENSHSYQNNSIWEIPTHLDGLIRAICRQVPGLELIPASLPDVKRLLGVFGLQVNDTQNEVNKRLKQSDQKAEGFSSRFIRPINEEALFQEGFHSNSTEKARTSQDLPSKPRNSPLKANNELESAISQFEKVTTTIENIHGDTNSVPITPTGKQIAERLVIKDLKDLLEILQSLAKLPESVQEKIAACQAYLDAHIDNSSKNGKITPDTLWEHIPGAVEVIEEILKELLSTYEGTHSQSEEEIQSA